MSENRISELEKEVEVLGVTLKHLIERMEKDTEASIENQKAQVETRLHQREVKGAWGKDC
jgi:hypothetical protein